MTARWVAIRLSLLLLAAALYFGVPAIRQEINRLVFLLSMADVHALRGWVEVAGPWAPLASIGLMIFQAIVAPLPAVMVTFANAALFGWVYGAVLSWTGAMAGAAICFGLARWFGRDLVERHAPSGLLQRLDDATARYGAWAVFVARLLPFVSFDAVSYAAGVLPLRFWPFFVATGAGQLPATIVYSLAGDLLAVDRGLLWGGILFMLAVATAVVVLRTVWTRRKSG